MELKKYQRLIIEDLQNFLHILNEEKNINTAYEKHWAAKGFPVSSPDFNGMPPYKSTIPQCPHVCIKVPTGGGKTFLACNALSSIYDYLKTQNKLVVWLVPSTSILEQTLKNLKDASHPYRQKLNDLFSHRVEVYDKLEVLNAQSFNATSVKENLSIMILSFASLRITNKEERKTYQNNGAYLSFFNTETDKGVFLDKPGVDEMSLINVIRQLNPVCVVDESHNTQGDLSVEMLKDLNPSFILDLTATPRENSNVITVADSMALKKENMVKLPVVVYNHNRPEDVIESAINLQKNLEKIAIENEANGENYIRPIVLFQAQSKGNEDSITFQKLKEKLIKVYGINENHIAIKTATINELKQENLLTKQSDIRFIITVNALKEGWDCPFAYILATIANRSAPVEVEQILGRILRLPNAAKQKNNMLNMSYVFTCNEDFQRTLDNIIEALNKQGFSKFNTRDKAILSLDYTQNESYQKVEDQQQALFENEKDTPLHELISDRYQSNSKTIETIAKEIEIRATAAYDSLERLTNELPDDALSTTPITDEMMQAIKIREKYLEVVKEIEIPQFMRINEQKSMLIPDDYILVDKGWLLDKDSFKLSQESTKINFDTISVNIREVDLIAESNKEYLPQAVKLNAKTRDAIIKHINSLSAEHQLNSLANMVINAMGKMPPVTQPDLIKYTKRVIEDLDETKLAELKQSPELYAAKLKKKIQDFMIIHAEQEFEKRLNATSIVLKPSYSFPPTINLKKSSPSGNFGLYTKEEAVNSLESKLKGALEEMDNIIFWHRNISKKGFELNGFINHYPDFIVYTKTKKIVLIETKGEHLNADKKIKLGSFYTKYSSQQVFYFMVFENNAPTGASDFDNLVDSLKRM
jgi:type III restriction enzyme